MTETPEQPEGIDTYSTALPTPEGAARRVNDFLSWFGDGLIVAETGKPPLFARDLQALASLATRDATVREFCAERAEYVRVLRQCTDASADYWRWNGHAEARRQLSERRLGLPTAWPAGQEGQK